MRLADAVKTMQPSGGFVMARLRRRQRPAAVGCQRLPIRCQEWAGCRRVIEKSHDLNQYSPYVYFSPAVGIVPNVRLLALRPSRLPYASFPPIKAHAAW